MKRNSFFYKTVIALARPFLKIFFPYEVSGYRNIKKSDKGYILCSNHLSGIDPIFLATIHPAPICFMAKFELFKSWIAEKFFTYMGSIAIKRGQGDKNALLECQKVIDGGDVLGIFIEGTRSKTGEFLRPRSGAAFLAYSTQCDVLPVCITGGGENNKVKMFKKTKVHFGKMISFESMGMVSGVRTEIKAATEYIMKQIKNGR